MFDTFVNTLLFWASCWKWWEFLGAKVNIEEDQFLRECPEYPQLPRNRFSTSFPEHLVSMMCLMLTKMALGPAVNLF